MENKQKLKERLKEIMRIPWETADVVTLDDARNAANRQIEEYKHVDLLLDMYEQEKRQGKAIYEIEHIPGDSPTPNEIRLNILYTLKNDCNLVGTIKLDSLSIVAKLSEKGRDLIESTLEQIELEGSINNDAVPTDGMRF